MIMRKMKKMKKKYKNNEKKPVPSFKDILKNYSNSEIYGNPYTFYMKNLINLK